MQHHTHSRPGGRLFGLATLITVGIVALLVVPLIVRYHTDSLYADDVNRFVYHCIVAGALLVGVYVLARYVVPAYDEHMDRRAARAERRQLVAADSNGLYPLDRARLLRGDFDQTQMLAALLFHQNGKGQALPVAPGVLPVEVPAKQLPGVTDLATLAHKPSADRILLGLNADNEHVTVPAVKLVHVGLIGATGGGKSNAMRLIVPQLQAIGAQVYLADPHFTPLNPDNGDDWRDIARRLAAPPAIKATDIDALLTSMTDELEKRLDLWSAGQHPGPLRFLAFDELPVITEHVPEAMQRIGRLLREGRKVGLMCVGASQDMLVKSIGAASALREAYRTAIYFGGDQYSASAMLDMPRKDIDDGPLGQGVALVRSAATPKAQLLRLPLASNGAVKGLLECVAPTMPDLYQHIGATRTERVSHVVEGVVIDGPGTRSVHVENTSGATAYSAVQSPIAGDMTGEQVARIKSLLREGKSVHEVASALGGTKNTNASAYRQARKDIDAVIWQQFSA